MFSGVRSGKHYSTDVSVWDRTVQLPWCVWYTTPTARHGRHLPVQRFRTQRITWYTRILLLLDHAVDKIEIQPWNKCTTAECGIIRGVKMQEYKRKGWQTSYSACLWSLDLWNIRDTCCKGLRKFYSSSKRLLVDRMLKVISTMCSWVEMWIYWNGGQCKCSCVSETPFTSNSKADRAGRSPLSGGR